MTMKRVRPILALTFDIAIVGFFVGAMVWLCLTDGKTVPNPAEEFLKYFTIQSNILLAAVALISIPFDILLLTGKLSFQPKALRVAFLAVTTGTTITMLVASFFLAPTIGVKWVFCNYNFIFHLVTPLLGVIRVIFFESGKGKCRFYFAFFGMIHLCIYGIVYLTNVVIHDGYGQAKYDWYGFGANGLGMGILSFLIIFALSFGLCFGLLSLQNLVIKKTSAEKQESK